MSENKENENLFLTWIKEVFKEIRNLRDKEDENSKNIGETNSRIDIIETKIETRNRIIIWIITTLLTIVGLVTTYLMFLKP